MSTLITSSSTVSHVGAKSSLSVLALIYPLAIGGYPLVAGLSALIEIENRSLSIAFRAIFLALCFVTLFRVVTNRIQITRGVIWAPIFVFWFSYLVRLALDTYVDPIELISYSVEVLAIWRIRRTDSHDYVYGSLGHEMVDHSFS